MRGYVTLLSVLIAGAVGVSIAVSLLLLGLSSSRTSFALQQSVQARGLANACAEKALQEIRDTSFAGSGNLTLESGACSYLVTSSGGENRAITSVGVVGTIQRKVEITIDTISSQINVTSWQEVADY